MQIEMHIIVGIKANAGNKHDLSIKSEFLNYQY